MPYQYASERNYAPFASGRVFYARPGQPAFPVRLADEVFQRARGHWLAAGGTGACHIYDPVCGGGYWLAVLAYLHWQQIARITASDLDPEALELARRNLGLLSPAGLQQRVHELEQLLAAYGKDSHHQALAEARAFLEQLEQRMINQPIEVKVFQADATQAESLASELNSPAIDLVLADVPYGWHSQWQSAAGTAPVDQMLSALEGYLPTLSVLAIASDKGQKVRHPAYRRLEQFNLGRRRVTLLSPKTG
jgi:SAM-dependent methyltransferase